MQGHSPFAEDLLWESQLQQDRSVIFPNIATATVQVPPLEQRDRRKDWDDASQQGIAKKELRSESPELRRALLLQDHSSSKDIYHQSCCTEATSNLETLTATPAFHEQSSTLRAAGGTDDKRTIWDHHRAPALPKKHTTQWLPAIHPVGPIDSCFIMCHEQWWMTSQSTGLAEVVAPPIWLSS